MSTNTIVLLILAVVILVVLILGFTIGWNKIAPWISKTNVKDVVGVCSTACATQNVYDFCFVNRELIDAEKNKFVASCAIFSTASEFSIYGVESCNLDCASSCEALKINGISGTSIQPSSDYYDVSALSEESGPCFIPKSK